MVASPRQRVGDTDIHRLSLSLHTHTHTLSLSHSHTHTNTHTNTHTRTHTHTHAHTHAHAHTHTLGFCTARTDTGTVYRPRRCTLCVPNVHLMCTEQIREQSIGPDDYLATYDTRTYHKLVSGMCVLL